MLNFAIVGCGNMTDNWHARELRKIPEVKVVALVDNNPTQTAAIKRKYFEDAVEFDSYPGLLENPPAKLDAVVLVTPHTLHYPQAKAALEKDINVLVEKPMVTASQHAFDLWRAVDKSGKLLAITFQAPHSREFAYLARERDAGRLGKMQLVTCSLAQGWLKGTAGKWRQDPTMSGGGQMYDSGAHALNALMWLMNDPVTEVACFYDKCGSPVDINAVAIAKFASVGMASITIGGNCPSFRTEIAIQTDTMLILTDMYGGKLEMIGRDGRKIYPHVDPSQETPAAGTPHLNFVRALEGKERLRSPVRYGVLVSVLMDALYASAESGTVVKAALVPESLATTA
ncbi:MAG TPA: Gfo/Idh/MocA family oxidoreductase [Polyangiaceae bacterium]